ncbi:uncharacterized protein LOC129753094 [Uranotaenia lowii]|uniref:uncharacterized protein LOC129753094 n=1 Tax=Uranotaenia lowii TaxID=190385 RepID=UPI002478DC30|nr:uncharacterized protein LOC129753094 [Uranotaenia lowii]
MVLINNVISPQTGNIAVRSCDIVSKRAIKYLEVIIDDRLSFTSHVYYVCKRAAMATAALTRMVSSSSAIRSSKRRILSCRNMLDTEKFSSRTKHIATKYHFVRDVKQKKEIDVVYCPTEDMVADLLTKPLSATPLKKLAIDAGLESTDRGRVLE